MTPAQARRIVTNTLRGPVFDSLPVATQERLLDVTWDLQDGYGEPGFTPPQGWDWSGIRDSSDVAMVYMARAIQTILTLPAPRTHR